MSEVPGYIIAFMSFLFHVCQKGGVFLSGYHVVTEVLKGFHKLWVKGSFSVIIISIIIRLE